MTDCTVKNAITDAVLNTDTFSHDAATNLKNSGFGYDANNRLVSFNGSSVTPLMLTVI